METISNLFSHYHLVQILYCLIIKFFCFFQAMEKSSVKKFLIDGFPRNENNLQGWNSRMHDIVDVKCVLFFDCPEEVSWSLLCT